MTTPETAAATQMLYAMADLAMPAARQILFHAISHLTGQPVTRITRTWDATR